MIPSRLFFWRRPWGFLLLLLPPILLSGGLYLLRWLLVPTERVLATAPAYEPALPEGLPGLILSQTLWGASLAVLFLVAACAALYAVILLRGQGKQGRRLLWLAGGLTAVLTVIFLSHWSRFDHPITDLLFEGLARSGLSGAAFGSWGVLDQRDLVAGIMSLNRILWFGCGILLALAAVAQADFAGGHRPASAAALRRRTKSLKLLLYLLSALLVAGVIGVHVLMDMALALVPPDDAARPLLEGYADGVILYFGTLLSLLLAAIYLPPALVLHLEADVMAEAAEGEDHSAIADWLERNGLRERPMTALRSVVAMLAPLASSPLLTLLQKAGDSLGAG